jgi:hypothetical protein
MARERTDGMIRAGEKKEREACRVKTVQIRPPRGCFGPWHMIRGWERGREGAEWEKEDGSKRSME